MRWPKVVLAIVLTAIVLAAAAVGLAYWQASKAIDQLHAGAKQAVVNAVKPELHTSRSTLS